MGVVKLRENVSANMEVWLRGKVRVLRCARWSFNINKFHSNEN